MSTASEGIPDSGVLDLESDDILDELAGIGQIEEVHRLERVQASGSARQGVAREDLPERLTRVVTAAQAGDYVTLALGYEGVSDASGGPLEWHDSGIVTELGPTNLRVRRSRDGGARDRVWW